MKKTYIYFITRTENVHEVLYDALERLSEGDVKLFFDLDGARVLDTRYLETEETRMKDKMAEAVNAGIKLYGCQLNVMGIDEAHLFPGAESAGVGTFLDDAFNAEAVFSF